MSNHIADANKMVSDTPRTDEAYFKNSATMYDLAGEMKQIERELNVANEKIEVLLIADCERLRIEEELNAAKYRIKRLEEFVDQLTNPKFTRDDLPKEALLQRIKRLEDAGDFLSRYLREMPYASDYLAQVDERILRISNWRRAKEDNL